MLKFDFLNENSFVIFTLLEILIFYLIRNPTGLVKPFEFFKDNFVNICQTT